MGFIKNFDALAKTSQREVILDLVEAAFTAIQPQNVLQKSISRHESLLTILDTEYDLASYERVFVIGFGKGSAGVCIFLEELLGDVITDGYVIDNVETAFNKLHFTKGSHPLPSQENIDFTNTVLENIKDLSEKDLVLVVICGGGSAMFEAPRTVSLETLMKVSQGLLHSGATISEMNVIRKHLSKVKGGGLAKHLYPARVVSLMFSDVPGNDMSVIASGPTTKDMTTLDDVRDILEKFSIGNLVAFTDFGETVSEDQYFEHITNVILVSNMTALEAMMEKADALGYNARIYSDCFQSDAHQAGEQLINETREDEIILVGGETTVKVKGDGKGGRNQTLVLSALAYLGKDTIICSFDSDGTDMYHFAGAIGDMMTVDEAQKRGLDPKRFLDDDNSYEFFEKVGDGIYTDKLSSNVSDLMIVANLTVEDRE